MLILNITISKILKYSQLGIKIRLETAIGRVNKLKNISIEINH